MDVFTPTVIIKLVACLFGTIGILIGVIWCLIRGEIKEVKESLKELKTSFAKIPIDFMSKKDCERIYNARDNKK